MWTNYNKTLSSNEKAKRETHDSIPHGRGFMWCANPTAWMSDLPFQMDINQLCRVMEHNSLVALAVAKNHLELRKRGDIDAMSFVSWKDLMPAFLPACIEVGMKALIPPCFDDLCVGIAPAGPHLGGVDDLRMFSGEEVEGLGLG